MNYVYYLGWSFIADGDYQKAERLDYRVDVLVSPLLNEVFKVNLKIFKAEPSLG